jgi:hypothetical protein
MSRQMRVSLGLGAALLLSACVESGGAITIVQNQVPETPVPGESACKVPSMPSEMPTTMGIYDVALDHAYPYKMFPLVRNGLPALSTGVDPNVVEINKWSVTIEPPASISVPWTAACRREFDFPSPLTLHPTQTGVAIIEGMEPCHGQLLRQLMMEGKISSGLSDEVIFRIIVRARGRHGSTEIKSDPFELPVRVCFGCLQTHYPDKDFADFGFPKVPACDRIASNPFQGNPCNPANEWALPLLCCARGGDVSQLECPGVARGSAATGP